MSTFTHEFIDRSMTDPHAHGVFARVVETLHLWRQRAHQRRELAQWSERDLHDLGLSWSEMIAEADKPFWRA